MKIDNKVIDIEKRVKKTGKKRSTRKFTHSLAYEVIANLVLQQYEKEGEVRFDLLWSIPVSNRIPALTIQYGKKRMFKLLVTLLKEFCNSIPLPKTRKLNDTRIDVCACDLMISAEEEALSIEDFIVFFEKVKRGFYGTINRFLTHQVIKEKLHTYLAVRRQAFSQFSEQKHIQLKALGPAERICEEPRQIGELLKKASVIDMNKKMSG